MKETSISIGTDKVPSETAIANSGNVASISLSPENGAGENPGEARSTKVESLIQAILDLGEMSKNQATAKQKLLAIECWKAASVGFEASRAAYKSILDVRKMVFEKLNVTDKTIEGWSRREEILISEDEADRKLQRKRSALQRSLDRAIEAQKGLSADSSEYQELQDEIDTHGEDLAALQSTKNP